MDLGSGRGTMFSRTITQRPRTTYPRSRRRELLCDGGDSETRQVYLPAGWKTVCVVRLRTDKEMGNLLGLLLAYSLMGIKGSAGACGKGGSGAGVH